MDRVLAAKVTKELIIRLGVHLKARKRIHLSFPTLGDLCTNTRGRIVFKFDPEFNKKLGPASADGATDGRSATASRTPNHPTTPLAGALALLGRLCREADAVGSGCVPRLTLEQWLFDHCRPALALVDAATVMDILSLHTLGKSRKLVQYRTFLEAFGHAIDAYRGREGRPHAPISPGMSLPVSRGTAITTGETQTTAGVDEKTTTTTTKTTKTSKTANVLRIEETEDGTRKEVELLSDAHHTGPAAKVIQSLEDAAAAAAGGGGAPRAPPVHAWMSVDATAPKHEDRTKAQTTTSQKKQTVEEDSFGPREPFRPATSGPRFPWMEEECVTPRPEVDVTMSLDYFAPRASRDMNRASMDAFNREHFNRLYGSRGWNGHLISGRAKDVLGSAVTPKVGGDRLMESAWRASQVAHPVTRPKTSSALEEQVRQKQEAASLLAAVNKAEVAAREAADVAAVEADAQKLREKRAANLAMRSVWEEQIRQKLAVQQRLVDAENKWPFVNEHNPLERVLPEKRYANRIRTAPGHVA